MMDNSPDTALYLYCIVPSVDSMPVLSSPALDGGSVHAIRYEGLAALGHACPPQPYQGGEEEVRAWIAAHNAVVEEAWELAGTVLPMSFDVLVREGGGWSAKANLVGWLAKHYEVLQSRLRAVEGRDEVGVQILWDNERLTTCMTSDARAASEPASGRAFFVRQELRRELKERLEQEAEAGSRRYFENLVVLADDVRVNKTRPVKLRQMVLNLSLLVARTGISRVGEYLEEVSAEPGVEVRFTGPWPPYSFAGTFATIEGDESSQMVSEDSSMRGDM